MLKKTICLLLITSLLCQTSMFAETTNTPPSEEEQRLAQEQQKMLAIVEVKDPCVYNACILEIKSPVETYMKRVSNEGEVEIKGVGIVKVSGKRISEIQNDLYKRFGYEFQLKILNIEYLVSVLGAVNQQRMVPPDYLYNILAECGGINYSMSNGNITVFNPEVGVARRYKYDKVVTGKDNIWINPNSVVDVQVVGGARMEAGTGPYLRMISYLLSIGGAFGIGYALANN